MSDLSQQNTESTVIAENTNISLNWDAGNKARGKIAAPVLQNIRSLPRVSKKKILRVRQQLVEGTYDIDRRLNTVIDRLLEDLVA
jgi:hypothetical protein